jgi:predicted ArsR family transcriptional regulator
MPNRRRKEYGLLSARLYIDTMRIVAEEFYLSSRAAPTAEMSLVGAAIYVGQLEGHPMTASKIADYIGMPRPTVIRKLHALAADGFVVRNGRTTWELNTKNSDIQARTDAVVERHMQLIRKASTELSRLDSVAIARRK